MTSAVNDLTHWKASFKRLWSIQTRSTTPHLAMIHSVMTEYVGILQAATKGQFTLDEVLLKKDDAGVVTGMTEVGLFLFQRLFEVVRLCPKPDDVPELPDHVGVTHQLSGSLVMFRELVLLPVFSALPRIRRLDSKLQIKGEVLRSVASLIAHHQSWCKAAEGSAQTNPSSKTRLTSVQKENKRFYDQLYLVKHRSKEYLHFLRSNHPNVHLIRLELYGHLAAANNDQVRTSTEQHNTRFDAFIQWVEQQLRSSLIGFHATLRASTWNATLFWDVCLVVGSDWWPDQDELHDFLNAQSIQISRCVDKHFTAEHSVYEWMKNTAIKPVGEWDSFWQQYFDQCIEPMQFMRLKTPKDFRLVRRGRLPRKKSKT
ncbi:hypothetical protein [Lampropedia aestuarii]|uniref:hypothetical protein n=1 Tax=Lampropedia aestuarii TaxID=2562762 RepID=UPI00246895DF|nr:hypothetical protein [Lampropedia aestuarii]MDH5859262.1 hypothetical protein [Lampropedia aestuarii]